MVKLISPCRVGAIIQTDFHGQNVQLQSYPILTRFPRLTFRTISQSKHHDFFQIMANFGKVDLDFTLFLRPFTYNSWAVIGATTLVCAVVALFYQTSSMEKYQEQTSARVVIQYIF